MRILGRIVLVVVVFALVLGVVAAGLFAWTVRRSFPQTDGAATLPALSADVTVIRDERGVPDIYADTSDDLYAALGYVHAQDRFYEMDFRRHVTSGRLSEMFGADQVETDAFLRTMDWRGVAEQEYQLLSDESRDILTAYAQGVNTYLADRSSAEISLEYVILGVQNPDYRIEKWDPVDSVAWLKALAWDLNSNYDQEIARVLAASEVGIEQAEALFPPYPYDRNGTIIDDARNKNLAADEAGSAGAAARAAAAKPAARMQFRNAAAAADRLEGVLGPVGEGIGSNSWVVDGSLTESGKPILANDPHLAPAMPSLWYQAGLHCRKNTETCPYNVSGWTMAGLPGVVIGHNNKVAWGLTNLGPDVSDLVLEKVRGKKYLVDGKRRPLLIRREKIKVAGGAEVPITIRATANGPIISDAEGADTYTAVGEDAPAPAPGQKGSAAKVPRGNGYAVSFKWTALTPRPTFDAVPLMNRAQDWSDFRRAAAQFAVPSQNLVYADTSGEIGYQAPGVIPVRRGYDGKWPVPGWDSKFEWQGYIPFGQLPSITDPPAGWITTANQAVVSPGYPQPVQSDLYSYGARAKRINIALADLVESGAKLTAADMAAVQLDAGNDLAEFLVPKLRRIDVAESTAGAMDLFDGWDYQQAEDSAAGAFFNAFYKNLTQVMFTDKLGADDAVAPNAGDRYWEVIRVLWSQPRNPWWDDPDVQGKQRRNNTVAAALDAAAAELTDIQGDDPTSWNWGELHLVEARNATLGESGIGVVERIFNRGPLPVGGGSSIPLATGWEPSEGYGVTWIPSMRQVVDLADLDRSTWVNFTGNSGHAYHPNYVDQFDAWVEGEQFAWPFTRSAVRDAASDTLTLTPQQQ